ncbi:MAG: GAF domain-containing protein [Chloroflexi bacterium]|nr:GAF domain-containing protein [Chloroflexota bacterium]
MALGLRGTNAERRIPVGTGTHQNAIQPDCPRRGLAARSTEALLRVTRRLAGDGDPSSVMRSVLDEAIVLVKGSWGAVARWDEERGVLVRAWSTIPLPGGQPLDIRPGEGAGGQAILHRRPVVINDYPQSANAITASTRAGIHAAIAVPLVREGRLLGAVMIGSDDPARRFTTEDAELLEMVACAAAAELAGLERARLEGALLLARTAQHHLSNQLALTVGYAEMLANDVRLPSECREYAREALRGAQAAASTLAQLQRITRLEASTTGPANVQVIDLTRSTASPPA